MIMNSSWTVLEQFMNVHELCSWTFLKKFIISSWTFMNGSWTSNETFMFMNILEIVFTNCSWMVHELCSWTVREHSWTMIINSLWTFMNYVHELFMKSSRTIVSFDVHEPFMNVHEHSSQMNHLILEIPEKLVPNSQTIEHVNMVKVGHLCELKLFHMT